MIDSTRFEVAKQQQAEFVRDFLRAQVLKDDLQAEQKEQAEAARIRRTCLTRSVIFEYLPRAVARRVAPPCPTRGTASQAA